MFCIFCKSFRFSKIVLEIRIMWFKNINDISKYTIFSYDNKIGIGRPYFTIDFVRNAKRP